MGRRDARCWRAAPAGVGSVSARPGTGPPPRPSGPHRTGGDPTTGNHSRREGPHVANPLQRLADFGQSFGLDNLSRVLITTGELARLIEQDGLRGITSNPTIFEKALASTHE